MKIRALFALAAVALCLSVAAGAAAASGAQATLSTNGSPTGFLHISGAPAGFYTVYEFTGSGYALVGTGTVGTSGTSDAVVAVLYSQSPSFQVRLRTSDGLTLIAAA